MLKSPKSNTLSRVSSMLDEIDLRTMQKDEEDDR